jgi:Na+/H+ antiporter NhaD/arsenite permease-like protein
VQVLQSLSQWLDRSIGNVDAITLLLGGFSAVIDNVPLVAAVQGAYSLDRFPLDHPFWDLVAYCAGTGGSALIIGSAAGVAAMGLERIEFFWWVRKVSWLAILGYLAGAAVFLLQRSLF